MPDNKTCSCCDKPTEPHLLLRCCVCFKHFFHACVNITSSEVRVINSKKSVQWTCIPCEKVGRDVNSLRAAVVALQGEIKELRQIKESACSVSISDDAFEEIISELDDRQSRKQNIIIFGVPEQRSDLGKEERQLAEEAAVDDILKVVSPDVNYRQLQRFRLGRFNLNATRPRPLKIKLECEKFVHDVIRRAKTLKNSPNHNNISLAFDKTFRQIAYYNKVKTQYNERVNKGENNISIKFVRGIPKIVNNLN